MITNRIRNNKSNIHKLLTAVVLTSLCLIMCSCDSDGKKTVEDEVSERLIETIAPEDSSDTDTEEETLTEEKASIQSPAQKNLSDLPSINEKKDTTGNSPSATARGTGNKTKEKTTEKPKNINPFLGDTSTATDFNIKFKIETDSGVAGITFGSNNGTDGEYYLFAFDCTREVPRLYTSRRIDDAVYDEEYTYLDFMYPEMQMFTDVQHIIEIKVNGNTATTFLDSYKVCDTSLKNAVSCGQIGTWVMDGNYHEYIDDLFVAEGIEGDGEWIYSDDFSRSSNLFYPDLKTRSGRLYATTGYYTAPSKTLK